MKKTILILAFLAAGLAVSCWTESEVEVTEVETETTVESVDSTAVAENEAEAEFDDVELH